MRKLTGTEMLHVYGGGDSKDCGGKGGKGGSGSRHGSSHKGSSRGKGSGSGGGRSHKKHGSGSGKCRSNPGPPDTPDTRSVWLKAGPTNT